jgi:hypothetical protein
MKKVMFTAIALIAFSSVSMGNTIAEEKVELDENKENVKMIRANIIQDSGCNGVWGSTRIYALNQGFTPDQASCIAMAALVACMGFDKAVVDSKAGTLC